MTGVFINSFGAFLPGTAVSNSEMENYVGRIGGSPSRNRALVLRQNRIKSRYYALNQHGEAQYSNAQMATEAVLDAVKKSEVSMRDISYLATATTIGDVLLPGLASHVHAGLKLQPIEVASFQSVCASSLMALKSAYMQINSGEHKCAAVSGSEFSSRYFRPGFYEHTDVYKKTGNVPLEADFLRFTLSDGAGAAILENKPNDRQLSLRVCWVDIRSYANSFETCMVGGSTKADGNVKYWGDFGNPLDAVDAGALVLTQNFSALQDMIPIWASHYLDLIDRGKIVLSEIDHVCSHYSSHSLREEAVAALKKAGALIDEEKWYSNLYTKGNTGAASIFIMLEELYASGKIKSGQKILCHVPESGRCLNGLMLLEAV